MFPVGVGFKPQISALENIGRSFVFQDGIFKTLDGSIVECTGIEAIRQWIRLALSTELQKYRVYDGCMFGVDFASLLGKKGLPSGFTLSEIKREVAAVLRLNPAISGADNFKVNTDGNLVTINFTVYLKSNEQLEVNQNVRS